MALDLGVLIGRVILDDTAFQPVWVRVRRQMAELGGQAQQAAAGTARLDEALGATGMSANSAAAGITRAVRAAAAQARVETEAAAATARHSAATARVSAVMSEYAGASEKVQVTQLRQVAAQENLDRAMLSGSASTAQLASRQATLVAASQRARAAQDEAAASTSRWRSSLSSTLRTAAGLGITIGLFEAAKKAIDITREAAQYQRSMVMIRTLTGASTQEMAGMSTALLGLSGPVGQAPEELATSLYHIESVGLRSRDALNAVKVSAEGAAIGQANLEDTTNALTATIASGIVKTHDFGRTMSTILAIVGAGDMRLQDFNDTLSSGVLTVAAQYGVTMRDFGAAMAVFGDNNIRGAHAATIFRMAVQGLAVPAKQGADTLQHLGLTQNTLAVDMQRGGLAAAITDLRTHLKAAGVSGKQTGQILTDAFGKRAGVGIAVLIGQYGRLQQKYGVLDAATDRFAEKWQETQHTAGFALQRLGAWFDAAGVKIANNVLPGVNAVVRVLGDALPGALTLAGRAVGPLFSALSGGLRAVWQLGGDVAHVLAPVAPLIEAMVGPLGKVAGAAAGAWLAFRAVNIIVPLIADLGRWVMTIPAQMQAMATRVGASVDQYMASMVGLGASTRAAAASATASMAGISDEAAAMSGAVVAEGEAATVGWVGMLGPLAALGVGLGLLFTMFHKSSNAAAASTQAVQAYGDALRSASHADLTDAITAQLNKADVPAQLNAINRELGKGAVDGRQFVSAIQSGGKPLDDMRARLQGIIDTGTQISSASGGQGVAYQIRTLSPAAQAATKALAALNMQYDSLTAAARKDLEQTRAWAHAASSIDKVAQSTLVSSDAAKQYAAMAGIIVDKNGVAAVSSSTLARAVSTVSTAYGSATATGSAFLKSLQDFSQSAATSADRAALIGATLVAANGDALSFAGAMNGSAVAVRQMGTDVGQAAQSSKESVRAWVSSMVNMRTGAINFRRAGAAPLINALQGIQSAGMQAAQAMYQHARSYESGKRAADDAYRVYVGQTRGALIDEFTRMTGNASAARKLADRYLGMPKRVKTLIEQEGANPVVDVLNKIGLQLSYLTGHPWVSKVAADAKPLIDTTADAQRRVNSIKQGVVPNVRLNDGPFRTSLQADQAQLDAMQRTKQVDLYMVTHHIDSGVYSAGKTGHATIPGRAAGGMLPPGLAVVGEHGAELAVTTPRGSAIMSNPDSRRFLAASGLRNVPGFAGGTLSGTAGAIWSFLAGRGLSRTAIAGVLGNLQIESGLRTTAYNPREGAIGLAQWEGSRRTGLNAFAARHHLSPTSLSAQLGWLWSELSGGYRSALSAIQRARSPQSAAAAFDAMFERSAGTSRGAREAAAGHFYSSGGAGASSGGATSGGGGGGAAPAASSGPSVAERRAAENALPGRIAGLFKIFTNPDAGASLTTALQAINENMRTAGTSARTVAAVTRAERSLTVERVRAAKATAQLAAMVQYRGTVVGTLRGGFDPTQYGSVGDLSRALGGATGNLGSFARDEASVRRLGLNTWLAQALEQAGPNPTLSMLARSSRGQIAQINKQWAAYGANLGSAGDAAVLQKYGISVAGQQGTVNRWTSAGDRYIAAIAQITGQLAAVATRPVQLTLPNGEVLAESVLGTRRFAAELHALANEIANR